jgi:hypothetical protein
MPGDQDWDPELWDRIGVGPEWDQIAADFEAAGAEVDDTEDVVLEFPAKMEPAVRAVVEAARAGEYGKDVQKYWQSAQEVEG